MWHISCMSVAWIIHVWLLQYECGCRRGLYVCGVKLCDSYATSLLLMLCESFMGVVRIIWCTITAVWLRSLGGYELMCYGFAPRTYHDVFVRDMNHSCHEFFISDMNRLCDSTWRRLYAWCDWYMCVTWLIYVRDTTLSYVRHDSFMCVAGLIHMYEMTIHIYVAVWNDHTYICRCLTRPIPLCVTTYFYVYHESFLRVT